MKTDATSSRLPLAPGSGRLALLTEGEIAAVAGGVVICYGPVHRREDPPPVPPGGSTP